MKHQKFSISRRLKSFSYAFNGLKILIKEEHNSRIHLFVSIVVIIASFVFKIELYEWFAIIFSIGIVFAAELLNSAIENIADFISPDKNYKIKVIKDLSSAAVLICALTAATIGLIVFIPKILSKFN